MSPSGRRSVFGVPASGPRYASGTSVARFAPTSGVRSDLAQDQLPAGSAISARNFWPLDNRLRTRPALTTFGARATSAGSQGGTWTASNESELGALIPRSSTAVAMSNTTHYPLGGGAYDGVDGFQIPIVISLATGSGFGNQLHLSVWSPAIPGFLVAIGSPTGANDDSGTTANFANGVTLFPSAGSDSNWSTLGDNVFVFTSGRSNNDVLRVWEGYRNQPSVFSYIANSPVGVFDLCAFDNRPVVFGTEASPVRVQWPIRGSFSSWAGTGAGSVDLTDMRGFASRIVATGSEMVLFSTDEIWRGIRIGGVSVFDFQPLWREAGAPFARTVLNTRSGIYWLGTGYVIYRYANGTIEEIGAAVTPFLRETLREPHLAFFAQHFDAPILELIYSDTSGRSPYRSLAYNVDEQTWLPQVYQSQHTFSFGLGGLFSIGTTGDERQNLEPRTLLFTSERSIPRAYQFRRSITSDAHTPSGLTASFASVPQEAVLATGLHDLDTNVSVREIRLGLRSLSASSLSVAAAGNFATAAASELRLALSASSTDTLARAAVIASGAFPVVQLRAENADLQVADVSVSVRLGGRPDA